MIIKFLQLLLRKIGNKGTIRNLIKAGKQRLGPKSKMFFHITNLKCNLIDGA